MPTLREIVTKFTLIANHDAVDKLNAGLDKAKGKLREVGEQSAGMDRLASSMEAVKSRLDFIIGYEAIKRFTELAERFAKIGEEINVVAKSLGLGVEQFQALTFAAEQSAVSQEQLSHGIMRLSRALFEARTGNEEAMKVFSYLGVQPGQISNIHSANDALFLLSNRLVNMQDPIAKLALVQKTLGRGSMEMVAFLSQGPGAIQAKMETARREGLIMSESQIEALERLNHAFEKLEAKGRVIAATFIEPLAPVVERLINDFVKLYNANKDWIGVNVEAFAQKIAYALGFIDGFVTTFMGNLKSKFGKSGIIGAILGDVAILGTAVTALAGFATALKLIATVFAASGLGTLASGALGLLGIGSAGAAAAGAAAGAEVVGTGAAGLAAITGIGGAGAVAGGGLLALLGPLLAVGGGVGLLGYLGSKMTGGTSGGGGRFATPAQGGMILQQNIYPSPGMDEKALADLAAKGAAKHWDQKMREAHRGVQGAKVGSN